MAKETFPKMIYVNREVDANDKDSSWLNAHESPDAFDTVAIYELVEKKRKVVKHELA